MSAPRRATGDPQAVRASVRVYRLLLRAFPTRFRREYARDVAQVFRDCSRDAYQRSGPLGLAALWREALADLFVAAARERVVEWREGDTAMLWRRQLLGGIPYVLALLFGLAIGWVNVHTDETPFVALPLLGLAGLLGLVWPRHPWRWALLVGVWLALGQGYALLTATRLPYPNGPTDVASVLGIGLALGLAGAYVGSVVGRLARSG